MSGGNWWRSEPGHAGRSGRANQPEYGGFQPRADANGAGEPGAVAVAAGSAGGGAGGAGQTTDDGGAHRATCP